MPAPMKTPATARLRLAEHVRACCADGQVILLDLQHNKYVGIGGAQLPALARAIEGWPVPPDATGQQGAPVDIHALTAPLLAQGLITSAMTAGPATTMLKEPMHSLNAADSVRYRAIRWRQLSRFIRSTATASAWLRWRSLAAIAHIVAARRARLVTQDDSTSIEATHEPVAAYLRLRPFAFTAHDRCLHDSLTLVHFLTSERVLANWVIGVRTQPFGAHSWVQSGDTVLNDQHEHVRRYRPILVV
jgi:Transglutaminase-like superfamily